MNSNLRSTVVELIKGKVRNPGNCSMGEIRAEIGEKIGSKDVLFTDKTVEETIKVLNEKGRYGSRFYSPLPGDFIFVDTGEGARAGIVRYCLNDGVVFSYADNGCGGTTGMSMGDSRIIGYGIFPVEKNESCFTGPFAELTCGELVEFAGSNGYENSYHGAVKTNLRKGKAYVSHILKGAAHPIRLVNADRLGNNVSAWVEVEDICVEESKDEELHRSEDSKSGTRRKRRKAGV